MITGLGRSSGFAASSPPRYDVHYAVGFSQRFPRLAAHSCLGTPVTPASTPASSDVRPRAEDCTPPVGSCDLALDGILRTRDRVLDYLVGPGYFDKRVQHLPLVSPAALVVIPTLYLVAVPLARYAMADRKPVDVRRFMTWHNVTMALLSLWMFAEGLRSQYYCAGWDKRMVHGIWGTMVQPGTTFSPSCQRLATVLYVHYLSKVAEFVDTFIMILKRNDRQISFLHIYHHASTFMCWWVAINFSPGGDVYFQCTYNSFVHVVMYTYYLLAGTKRFHIPVAIKQAITVMQMLQFVAFMLHALYGFFIIDYFAPMIVVVLALSQGFVFLMLFGNFFVRTYFKKKGPKKTLHANGPKKALHAE